MRAESRGLCSSTVCRTLAKQADPARRSFCAGKLVEIIARALAARLSTSLGQQVYVENKPGAAGNVAMEDVKRAPPDGHTLILGHVGTLAVNPALFGAALPYDPTRDFVPISLVATVPNVIAVNPDVPARTLAEFVNLVKAQPGKLNYGSAGNGSAGHFGHGVLQDGGQAGHRAYPLQGHGADADRPPWWSHAGNVQRRAADRWTDKVGQVKSARRRLGASHRDASRRADDRGESATPDSRHRSGTAFSRRRVRRQQSSIDCNARSLRPLATLPRCSA